MARINDYSVDYRVIGPFEKLSGGSKPHGLFRLLADATSALSASGVPSARVDAELLAAHVLGVPRGRLILTHTVTPAQRERFALLVAARADRVPLQHLTGRAPFRHLELAVGPGVFVPRPETELLAGWGIETAKSDNEPNRRAPVVVDLCSGSGAIALAVAHEVPGARVYAVEQSPAALAWLRRNAETQLRSGDPSVTVVPGDATDPTVLADLDGQVDLVLCNPPYVPDGTPVPPEVAEHDPAAAVFAGADGLAVIRPVASRAAALLRPGGGFGVEHGDGQAAAVAEALVGTGAFTEVSGGRDLADRPRYTTARRLSTDQPRPTWQTDSS